MNKVLESKISNRIVVVMSNIKKEVIGYQLQKVTPIHKRVISSEFTKDRLKAKVFLDLM